MRDGLRMVRDLVSQEPLSPFAGDELVPGSDHQSDEAIDEHVRKTMITVHHPVGTCKMGGDNDQKAVVDHEMRVRGVENLRVIDTSVMPDLIGVYGARAEEVLRARGFRVSVVGAHPYPGVEAGVVLRQFPRAGFQIAHGEAISLEVSQ